MTKRRRRRKKTSRTNDTAHHRALQNPDVGAKISDLRKRWRYLDRIDRGDHLLGLIALGCSMRGLASELRRSLTTTRRHIDLADSVESTRKAVRNGSSAKKILAKKVLLRNLGREKAMVEEEQKSGKHSDAAADLILEFFRHLGYSGPIVQQLLPEVLNALTTAAVWGARPHRVSKKLSTDKLFSLLRPEETADEFWTAHDAKWLARVLQARFPLAWMWERAIPKAAMRASELDPPQPSPQEIYMGTALRRQFIAEMPSRRKC